MNEFIVDFQWKLFLNRVETMRLRFNAVKVTIIAQIRKFPCLICRKTLEFLRIVTVLTHFRVYNFLKYRVDGFLYCFLCRTRRNKLDCVLISMSLIVCLHNHEPLSLTCPFLKIFFRSWNKSNRTWRENRQIINLFYSYQKDLSYLEVLLM